MTSEKSGPYVDRPFHARPLHVARGGSPKKIEEDGYFEYLAFWDVITFMLSAKISRHDQP